jgi:hypothetical protein
VTLAATESEDPSIIADKCDALARIARLRTEIARLDSVSCQFLVFTVQKMMLYLIVIVVVLNFAFLLSTRFLGAKVLKSLRQG